MIAEILARCRRAAGQTQQQDHLGQPGRPHHDHGARRDPGQDVIGPRDGPDQVQVDHALLAVPAEQLGPHQRGKDKKNDRGDAVVVGMGGELHLLGGSRTPDPVGGSGDQGHDQRNGGED